jgi:hypothetical protein
MAKIDTAFRPLGPEHVRLTPSLMQRRSVLNRKTC